MPNREAFVYLHGHQIFYVLFKKYPEHQRMKKYETPIILSTYYSNAI